MSDDEKKVLFKRCAKVMPRECPARARVVDQILGVQTEVPKQQEEKKFGTSRTSGKSIYKRNVG